MSSLVTGPCLGQRFWYCKRWPQAACRRWKWETVLLARAGYALTGKATRLRRSRPDQLGRPRGALAADVGATGFAWGGQLEAVMRFSRVRGWGDEESLPRVAENLQGIPAAPARLAHPAAACCCT